MQPQRLVDRRAENGTKTHGAMAPARPFQLNIDSPFCFWSDTHHNWQVSAGQDRTCTRGLRISN